jgi:hypothetical protein
VHAFKPEYHDDPRFLSPRAGFHGTSDMEGSRLRYVHDVVLKECEIGEPAHMHHGVEEYLFFTGSDISKFYEFDAVAEIDLGEDPDHMETYTITEASVVRIPQKMWHGPVRFKRVGAPVQFLPFYPCGEYGKIYIKDGVYVYEGTDLPK